MKYCLLFFLLLPTSCSENSSQQNAPRVTVTSNDTVPIVRKQVNKRPVASYMIPINNPLLQQYFGVKIFKTPLTFQYFLKMQYEGMIETDTLKIPNFGTWPVVKVIKGKEKMSCIIGFLDKEKNFKEYKMLVAKDNKLKLVTLRRYGVGVYQDTK